MSQPITKRARTIITEEDGECTQSLYFVQNDYVQKDYVQKDFVPLPPKETIPEYIKRTNKEKEAKEKEARTISNKPSSSSSSQTILGYSYGEDHNNNIISLLDKIKNYKKSVPQNNVEKITADDLKITYKDNEYDKFVNCFTVKYNLLFAEKPQYKQLFINSNEVLYAKYKIELHTKLNLELIEKKRKFAETLPQEFRALYTDIEKLNDTINNH